MTDLWSTNETRLGKIKLAFTLVTRKVLGFADNPGNFNSWILFSFTKTDCPLLSMVNVVETSLGKVNMGITRVTRGDSCQHLIILPRSILAA